MNNQITNWSYDKPTEEGDYLVCWGDVETQANIMHERFIPTGVKGLQDLSGVYACDYSNSCKFARLVYASTELKKLGHVDDSFKTIPNHNSMLKRQAM